VTEGEPYEAERHLLLGTPSSPPILASLHYSWYTTDSPHLAAIYASRSVLPYLLVGNLASANLALSTFTSHLTTSNPALLAMSQPLESSKSSLSLRIFPSIPLLNFLSLLLLAAQKGDSNLFKQLAKYYAPHIKDVEGLWAESLAKIGELWFGIRIPRAMGNPLMDMMGSMLFGGQGGNSGAGNGGARANTPKAGQKKEVKEVQGPPPAMDLD
jgi:golgi to ER traffic protein 4